MKRTVFVFIFIFLFGGATGSLYAQAHWVPLPNTVNGNALTAASFLNEQFGLVQTSASWFRTTDGGANWETVSGLPTNIPDAKINIYFYTPTNIYVNGRFESTDSGKTFTTIRNFATAHCIYIHDGIIYDGAGRSSSDHFKTWDVIANVAPGETVVGNLDNGIAMWDLSTSYTLDNAKTWASGQLGVEADYGYAIPFTLTYFRSGGDGHDGIQRTTDGGATWATVVGQFAGDYLTDGIGGDGCVVFAQAMASIPNYPSPTGVLRSTDRGITWVGTGGPLNNDDYPLCGVCSRGAVCYAMSYNAGLPAGFWKYTDSALYRSILLDTKFVKMFPDTIVMNDCDSLNIALNLSFSPCDFVRLHNVWIDSLSPINYRCVFTPDTIIRSQHPYLSTITLLPTSPGIYHLQVHYNLSATDWSGSDTTFPFVLIVKDTPPVLDIQPSGQHNYGVKSICSAARKDTILLINPSCQEIQISDIRLEADPSSVNDFSISKVSPYDLFNKTDPNTIIINYNPKSIGAKNAKIIIVTSIGIDTIPLFGTVLPDTSHLIILRNDTINFGARPLCLGGGKDTITITNPGCHNIIIKNTKLLLDPASFYDLSISHSGSNNLEGDSSVYKIFVDFHPTISGKKSGMIIIENDFHNDTIQIVANVVPDSRLLFYWSDEFQSPMCDSVDGFIHLINLSCREMRIDQVTLARPFVVLPFRSPVVIESGDTAVIPVRFIPSQRGASNVSAQIAIGFYLPSGTVEFDTMFTLSGFATHGASAYKLSSTSITFDSLHLCDTAKQRLVLHSTGCDSLPLSISSISGDTDFTYSILGAQPSALATGDSIVVDISLIPHSIGDKSATITIKLLDSIVTIPLTGTIIRAPRFLYSDRSGTLDFGSHLVCQSSDRIITLTNPGCDTVRVSGIGLRGSGFGVVNAFPLEIPPGGSRMIDVKTIIDTLGGKYLNTDTLDIHSNADNSIDPTILTRTYRYPHPLHLWLAANQTPLTSGSLWKVKVKSLANELTDISTIDFSLSYNSNLLEYNQSNSSLISGDGKTFHLAGAQLNPGSDSALGEIAFNVYLTTDTTTTILLDNISLNADDPIFMGCAAYPLATGIDFNYFNICGDPSIRTFMLGLPIAMTIRPNPAHDEIEVEIVAPAFSRSGLHITSGTAESRPYYFTITDAIGKQIFSEERDIISGTNEIHIDSKNLSGGIYILRINSASGTASQSFVKVR